MTMFTRQLQPHHHAIILYLVIFFAFVTCEALSLSLSGSGSLSQIRSSGVMKLESSKYNTQIQGPTFARIQNSKTSCSQRWPRREQQQQYTTLYMATTDDSNKNGDHADDKDLSSSSSNNVPFFEEPNEQSKKAMSDEQNMKKNTTMTVILTIPLFIKFFAVLCIKFLTDAVVFPSLFLYRILRKTKRKIISLFQQGPGSIKPNGATPVEK
jgi:hypothetical protein